MALLLTSLIAVLIIFFKGSILAYDINVSNGTCYYEAGKRLNEVFSPAGNVALGHTFCCQLGDKLNNHDVCVNGDSDYTYIAGCTDPTYQNENCPKKANYSDYAWVGLVKCNNTDSSGQVSWVGCVNDGSPTVMESNKSEGCTCDLEGEDPDQELFRAPTGLDAWGLLPTTRLGEIEWFAGYPPTTITPYIRTAIATFSVPPSLQPSSSTATTNSASVSITFSPITVPPLENMSGTFTTSATSSTSSTVNPHSVANLKNWSPSERKGFYAGITIAAVGTIVILLLVLRMIYRCYKPKPDAILASADFQVNDTTNEDTTSNGRARASWPDYWSEPPRSPACPGSLVPGTYTPADTRTYCEHLRQQPSRRTPVLEMVTSGNVRSPTDEMITHRQGMPSKERPRLAQTGRGMYRGTVGLTETEHDRLYKECVAARQQASELPG